MSKIWTITWKDVYTTLTDRSLIVIMFVTPLLISTIVAIVFGGLSEGGGAATFSNLPVAVVNQDEGAQQLGSQVNYGQDFVNLVTGEGDTFGEGGECPLVASDESNGNQPQVDSPQQQGSLSDFLDATVLDNVESARDGVENGDYVAAVIIPAEFSQSLSPDIGPQVSAEDASIAPIEVYGDGGQPISASIVRSIVDGYANQIRTGNVAVATTVNTLISTNPAAATRLANNQETGEIFNCGYSGVLNTVSINPRPVDDENQLSGFVVILIAIGSAQAVFFALFSGQFGVLSIIEEQRNGTLQRMIVSPTPRSYILGGKLGGTFATVVAQLVILMLSLTLIASLIDGELMFIWGSNVLGLTALVLALSLAVCGIGTILAGIVKTPEQAGAVGSVVNIVLGIFGGAFGTALPSPFRELSLVYWGVDGFSKLAEGNPDILLNLVVLVGQGVILFFIGLFLFNRRMDI